MLKRPLGRPYPVWSNHGPDDLRAFIVQVLRTLGPHAGLLDGLPLTLAPETASSDRIAGHVLAAIYRLLDPCQPEPPLPVETRNRLYHLASQTAWRHAPRFGIDATWLALGAFLSRHEDQRWDAIAADLVLEWYLTAELAADDRLATGRERAILRGSRHRSGSAGDDPSAAPAEIGHPVPSDMTIHPARAYALRPGDLIWFADRGNGERLLLPGDWHPPEGELTWSRKANALLAVGVQSASGAGIELDLDMVTDRLHPKRDRAVTVTCNGREVYSTRAGGWQRIRAALPAFRNDGTANILGLHVARPFLPARHGSHDGRTLGVGIARLRLLDA